MALALRVAVDCLAALPSRETPPSSPRLAWGCISATFSLPCLSGRRLGQARRGVRDVRLHPRGGHRHALRALRARDGLGKVREAARKLLRRWWEAGVDLGWGQGGGAEEQRGGPRRCEWRAGLWRGTCRFGVRVKQDDIPRLADIVEGFSEEQVRRRCARAGARPGGAGSRPSKGCNDRHGWRGVR